MIELGAVIPIVIWLHVLAALAAIVSEEHSEKKDAESLRRLELLEDAQRKKQMRADSSKCKSNEVDLDFDEPILTNLEPLDQRHCQSADEDVTISPDEYVYRTLSSSGIEECKDAWPIGTNPSFPWFVYQRTGEYATENGTTFWYRADLYVKYNPILDRYAACSAFEHAIKEVSSGYYQCKSEILYYIDVWHYTYMFTYVQATLYEKTSFYAGDKYYVTIRQDMPPTYGT